MARKTTCPASTPIVGSICAPIVWANAEHAAAEQGAPQRPEPADDHRREREQQDRVCRWSGDLRVHPVGQSGQRHGAEGDGGGDAEHVPVFTPEMRGGFLSSATARIGRPVEPGQEVLQAGRTMTASTKMPRRRQLIVTDCRVQ